MTEATPSAGFPALTRMDLIRVFFRSFLFQSLWSFQRMQNVGWLFSLWPVFRRLYPDLEERAKAVQEHGGYFNTHPYTADIILGVAASLEEKRARDRTAERADILSIRKSMSGPLSALGETVFWATLGPLVLIGAVVVGMTFDSRGWLVTSLLYLVVFNILHVAVKAGGLAVGYRRGLDVAAFLVQWPVQRWTAKAAWMGVGVCAGVLALSIFRSWHPLAAGLLVAGTFLFLRRGLSPLWLPLAAVFLGIVTHL